MNLADKQVYPEPAYSHDGITYREALILALAGNSAIVKRGFGLSTKLIAQLTIRTADVIIKEMEIYYARK